MIQKQMKSMSLTSNSILIVLFENNFPTQYLSQNLFNITIQRIEDN